MLESLELLKCEDPSVSVSVSEETGELLVGGMGELHLEIVQDRLKKHYGVQVRFGEPIIARRSTLRDATALQTRVVELRGASGAARRCAVRVRVRPAAQRGDGVSVEFSGALQAYAADERSGQTLLATSKKRTANEALLVEAVRDGVAGACAQGIAQGAPLTDVCVELHGVAFVDGDDDSAVSALLSNSSKDDETLAAKIFGVGGGASALRAAADAPLVAAAVSRAIVATCQTLGAPPLLLEPFVVVEVQLADAAYVGAVLTDLVKQRKAIIYEAGSSSGGDSDVAASGSGGGVSPLRAVVARAPLSQMASYASALRSLTRGSASFSMNFDGFSEQ